MNDIRTFTFADNFLGFSTNLINRQFAESRRRSDNFNSQILAAQSFTRSSIDNTENLYYGLARMQSQTLGALAQSLQGIALFSIDKAAKGRGILGLFGF